jgi:thioredoxin-related protein
MACGGLMVLLVCFGAEARADSMDGYRINSHGTADIRYPGWFKDSFLDLRDDLREARTAGKRGLMVLFSQKNCAHCQAFIDTTLSDPATRGRVQKHYDVISLDIFNDVEVTDIDGRQYSIRQFAETQRARLTPTLLFYGVENARLLKIIGFYPPEKFNRVLDYIDGEHYQREKLGHFLRRTSQAVAARNQEFEFDYSIFSRPPHLLDRHRVDQVRPLLVMFDRPDCKACRRFHQRVLGDEQVRKLLQKFVAVQLDATDDATRVIAPDGTQVTPRQWVDKLELAYEPALVFFDGQGREVHRLDAETGKDRMVGSMQYVLEKAYLRFEQFLRWRKENAAGGRRTM